MPLEEKIRTMETIRDDLSRKAGSISSPSWHEEVLNKREERIKKGREEFIDCHRSPVWIKKICIDVSQHPVLVGCALIHQPTHLLYAWFAELTTLPPQLF